MKYELFDYQDDAVAAIAKHLIRAARDYDDDPEERTAVLLAAPTGAGKTVIATGVIEASLDGDESTPGIEHATFLWVTDDPSLNNQTAQKMMASSSALAPNRLIVIENDFDAEVFEPGAVYFLNIQKLSANATLSKSRIDGRTYSLWETIANTIAQRPHGFCVVIDEAHRGMKTVKRSRDSIVSQIINGGAGNTPAPVVWGISATPKRFVDSMSKSDRSVRQKNVRIEDVRASGLLKDAIVLGHTGGKDAAESALVRFAVERVRTYSRKWAAYTESTGEPLVKPALVVQVADKPSSDELGQIVSTIIEDWPEVDSSSVVHTFAEHAPLQVGAWEIPWCPPEDIQDRPDIRVVLCKTAITTGWDCPRAEVLLSFRVAKDLDLITQIMGRMVRTPLARRVDTDQDLNAVHCILPKFDEAAAKVIAERFQTGGDEDLADGTQVITNPVELTRNPAFGGSVWSVTAKDTPNRPTESVQEYETTPVDSSFLATPTHALPGESTATEKDSVSPGPHGPAPQQTALPGTNRPVTPTHHGSPGSRLAEDGTAQAFNSTGDDLFAAVNAPTPEVAPDEEAPQDVFDVITDLASYTIPRRLRRPNTERLTKMAMRLGAQHHGVSIDRLAPAKAEAELMSVIDTRRQVLTRAGEMEGLLEEAGKTGLYEITVGYADEDTKAVTRSSTLRLDERGIGLLMRRTEAKIPAGLAKKFARQLVTQHGMEVREAMLTVIALASDTSLAPAIEERASQLVEAWFKTYGGAISRLPAPDQVAFDQIKMDSDVPLETTITLAATKTSSADGDPYTKHVLTGPDGLFRTTLGSWEKHVVSTELEHDSVLAWYRNPSGGRGALTIPYRMYGEYKGLYPDFVFVEKVGKHLRASIVDPHGTHLADAVPKLQALSWYAEKHGGGLHRIQSVSLVDGTWMILNHQDPQVRTAINDYEGDQAADLFRQHGVNY